MQRSMKHLTGFAIEATDGEIGKVDDFYFDDQQWTIRYMVVNTGGWLAGRRVLIAPVALGRPLWESQAFPVTLTMDQVRHSPDIDTDKPVSRQHEVQLHQHYAWPMYWEGAYFTGDAPMLGTAPSTPQANNRERGAAPHRDDPHLFSARQVMGYHVQARDGAIGHVEDLIVDDAHWRISHLVVDTRHGLARRDVLLLPKWIQEVNWEEARVFTSLDREAVRRSAPYDPTEPLGQGEAG